MIRVVTDHPVAVDSRDHVRPLGAKQDNSLNLNFNRKLFQLIPAEEVALLDLGCAGGALVKSILDDGGFAIGIEGSDYSRNLKRAEWAIIPSFLFTADATKPFDIQDGFHSNRTFKFNVITAWEFFEHIKEIDIPAVVSNMRRHSNEAIFIGSISEHDEYHHVTLKPKKWWIEKLDSLGMTHAPDLESHFAGAYVRTTGWPIAMRMGI